MNDWPIRKLSNIVEFQNRKRIPLKSADRALRQGAYPYYGASGIVDWIDDYLFEGKHLLISEDGENLRSRTTPIAFRVYGRFWVNNHAHVVTESEPGILDYLEYALARFDLAPYITGAAQPKLNKGTLEAIQLHVPPVDERLAINSILNSLTDKIELNRRMSATLEEMARALFRSWFVDFDPVHAKARGEAPAHMDAATAALFPDRFGEDGLPEGWHFSGLDEVADFLNGLALQKFPAVEGCPFLPVIKIAELRSGVNAKSGRAAREIQDRYVVRDGDVLFSWSGSLLQKVWTGGEGALNQHLFKVTSTAVPKWFHFFAVDQHMEEFRAVAASKATTMGHIQRHHLRDAKVVVPDSMLLSSLNAFVAPLFSRWIQAEIESDRLAVLRDQLLPKLMSGELRVRDAERQVAEVV